jgi:hypothetical protein
MWGGLAEGVIRHALSADYATLIPPYALRRIPGTFSFKAHPTGFG